jgi:hypothetical protein
MRNFLKLMGNFLIAPDIGRKTTILVLIVLFVQQVAVVGRVIFMLCTVQGYRVIHSFVLLLCYPNPYLKLKPFSTVLVL